MDRFWSKVDKRGTCWVWTAAKNPDGYGKLGPNCTGETKAHRISWVLAHGPVPDKMHVLHSCDNRRCVNPAHLSLGTHQQNMADRERRGRGIKGERVGISRLTENAVRRIRIVWPTLTQYQLAEIYSVAPSTIYYAATGKTWRHLAS